MIHAYAAHEPGGEFKPFEYDPGELPADEIEITVDHCGICHSDLSMLNNDWGNASFPFVGGHEVIGHITKAGPLVPNLTVGDHVGVGWTSRSCMHCDQCMSGHHNRCASNEGLIVGRYGGFADKVRCHWAWATKLPEGFNLRDGGPLFCGGITVFQPIVQHAIAPTARVGVIGIGGLGHMALMFLNKWGCHVTAFSTSRDKQEEARRMGADEFVATDEPDALSKLTGKFDMVVNTTNVRLDWDAYAATLAPGGVLHTVGAVLDTFGVSNSFNLLVQEKSLSASPLGPPATVRKMVDFCARHQIAPITEHYPLAKINDAFEKLRSGSPRYRLVLDMH